MDYLLKKCQIHGYSTSILFLKSYTGYLQHGFKRELRCKNILEEMGQRTQSAQKIPMESFQR